MGLLDSLRGKNPDYPDGKKPFFSIIKCEAEPGFLFWKVPYEDFNEGSKVIVDENQELLFYKNGVILESLTAGQYTLDTDNFPFLTPLRSVFTGGVSSYNCKVFYVNKAHSLDMMWGTDAPIQVVDRKYDIATKVKSRGAYTVQVADAKKFYLKYAGSNVENITPDDVKKDFRAPFNQTVKSVLGRVIQSIDDEIIGICARQAEVAEMVKPELKGVMDEYGLRLVNFYIEAIEVADDASRKALEEARVARASTIIGAQGEKARLDTLGITWQQDKNMEVMNNLAQNEGNILATAGAGLGMGIAAGGAFGSMAANTMAGAQQPPQPAQPAGSVCPSCKTQISAGAKFCPGCGTAVSAAKFCTNCGNKLEAGAKFCPNCGQKAE